MSGCWSSAQESGLSVSGINDTVLAETHTNLHKHFFMDDAASPESSAPPCLARVFEGQQFNHLEADGIIDDFGNTCLM